MKHELTYVEDDPKGYGDGLSDFYRCTCGETFQANGDIIEAFDHGQETRLDELLREHTPSLTDEDEYEINDKAVDLVNSAILGTGDVDVADLARRTCRCGVRIDGFYEYIDHLRNAAGITPVLGGTK